MNMWAPGFIRIHDTQCLFATQGFLARGEVHSALRMHEYPDLFARL